MRRKWQSDNEELVFLRLRVFPKFEKRGFPTIMPTPSTRHWIVVINSNTKSEIVYKTMLKRAINKVCNFKTLALDRWRRKCDLLFPAMIRLLHLWAQHFGPKPTVVRVLWYFALDKQFRTTWLQFWHNLLIATSLNQRPRIVFLAHKHTVNGSHSILQGVHAGVGKKAPLCEKRIP